MFIFGFLFKYRKIYVKTFETHEWNTYYICLAWLELLEPRGLVCFCCFLLTEQVLHAWDSGCWEFDRNGTAVYELFLFLFGLLHCQHCMAFAYGVSVFKTHVHLPLLYVCVLHRCFLGVWLLPHTHTHTVTTHTYYLLHCARVNQQFSTLRPGAKSYETDPHEHQQAFSPFN